MNGCLFCKIVKKEIPANIVFEDESVICFLDIHPSNPGHLLVVPKVHASDILETPDDVLAKTIVEVKRIGKLAMGAVKAQGFNVILNTKSAAGQVIFHTHFHIIPRFSGDGLKHWSAKDIPEEEMEKVAVAIKKLL